MTYNRAARCNGGKVPDAYYDIVIGGFDLSGLLYGAMCARHGYRVLVLGHDSRLTKFAYNSAYVVRRPEVLFGFESSRVIRRTLTSLNIQGQIQSRLVHLEPTIQFVTPETRVDFSRKAHLLQKELKRELPGMWEWTVRWKEGTLKHLTQMEDMLAGLPVLPPKGYWQRRSLRKMLTKSEHLSSLDANLWYDDLPSDLAKVFLVSCLQYLCRLNGEGWENLAATRLLYHFLSGLHLFSSGIDGLKQILADSITTGGGDVRPQAKIQSIRVKRGRMSEIRLTRPAQRIGFRLLVCNTKPKKFVSLIPPEQQFERVHSFLAGVLPSRYLFPVNFLLRNGAIPVGMGQNLLLVVHPSGGIENCNVIWLQRVLPPPGASRSLDTLAAFCFLRASRLPSKAEQYKQLLERILCAVEWVIPFIRDYLEDIFTPYLTKDRGTGELRLDSNELIEYFGEPLNNTLGLSAFPMLTKYKNFLLLGDGVMGGLGVEGDFLAANLAYQYTIQNLKIKQIIKQED